MLELTYFDAETFRSNSSNESRGNVHVKIESPRHKFGKPVAGNFFYVVWNHIKGKHFFNAEYVKCGIRPGPGVARPGRGRPGHFLFYDF